MVQKVLLWLDDKLIEDAFMVGGMNGLKMFLWFDVAELGLLHFLHGKKRHASQSKCSFDTILSIKATGDKHFTVNSDRLSQQLTRVPILQNWFIIEGSNSKTIVAVERKRAKI